MFRHSDVSVGYSCGAICGRQTKTGQGLSPIPTHSDAHSSNSACRSCGGSFASRSADALSNSFKEDFMRAWPAVFLCLLMVCAVVGCGTPGPTQPDSFRLPNPSLASSDPMTSLPLSTAPVATAPSSQRTARGPKASEQLVFSGVATMGSTFPSQTPVGFWIWCEAESENPYDGECNGAMYFYALHITRHVEGEVVETSEGIYEMTVSSTQDTSIINCVLKNTEEAQHGPNNAVQVTCSTPSGSATSTTSVVNVTGP